MKPVILLISLLLIAGCSWQGQKYQEFDSITGKVTTNDECWSMRFIWMSGGIELHNKTPHYTIGAEIATSAVDPNTAKEFFKAGVETVLGFK